MTSGIAHLYPPPVFNLPAPQPRLVRDYVRGRQYGVDAVRFGVPYLFARFMPDAPWVLYAGPFADEPAAVAYAEAIS